MSSAIYVPKGIAMAPTFDCPGMCDHCNIPFDKTDTSIRLPVESAVRVLHEAKAMGLTAVQIVGGEPTLCPDFFTEIFRKSRRLGMRFHRPPTNCSIGKDTENLKAFFSELKSAGYSSGFRMSLDYFHRRIPITSVSNFILTASGFFSLKPFVIGCCDIDEERSKALLIRLSELLSEGGLASEYSDRKLKTIRGDMRVGFWAPTRPTWKELPDSMFRQCEIDASATKAQQLKKGGFIGKYPCLGHEGVGYFWVKPDGDVCLCCGNAVNFIDSLVFGNIHSDSLSEIHNRAISSQFVSILAEGGPVALAIHSGREDLLQKRYTHRCELCNALLGSISLNYAVSR